jgi:hypothetical protein
MNLKDWDHPCVLLRNATVPFRSTERTSKLVARLQAEFVSSIELIQLVDKSLYDVTDLHEFSLICFYLPLTLTL